MHLHMPARHLPTAQAAATSLLPCAPLHAQVAESSAVLQCYGEQCGGLASIET